MTEEGQKFIDGPQRRNEPNSIMTKSKIGSYWENSRNRNQIEKKRNLYERNSSVDSNIWEQWNFERKLDQSIHPPAPKKRYRSYPYSIPQNKKDWTLQLKEEVKNELLRFVKQRQFTTQVYRGSLEEAWNQYNFRKNQIPNGFNRGFEKDNYYHHTDPDYHEKKNRMTLRIVGGTLLNILRKKNSPFFQESQTYSKFDQNYQSGYYDDYEESNFGRNRDYTNEESSYQDESYYEPTINQYYYQDQRVRENSYYGNNQGYPSNYFY